MTIDDSDTNSILYYSVLCAVPNVAKVNNQESIPRDDAIDTKKELAQIQIADACKEIKPVENSDNDTREAIIKKELTRKIRCLQDDLYDLRATKQVQKENKTSPTLELYYWCWAEYQNKLNKDMPGYEPVIPYDINSGTQKIIDELKYYHSPEKLEQFVKIWQELDRVSFQYAIFLQNEVIVGEPSVNVKNVGQNISGVNITYHIRGRYCGHPLLIDKFRDLNYKSIWGAALPITPSVLRN